MAKKRIIILGGGLAGLSAAWHLQQRKRECLLFEKEPEVGGLCRSKKIGEFTFDYDGHLLHFRRRYTFDLVRRLLGGNLTGHRRNAWIYTHKRYIRYPFQANLYGLPADIVEECLLGFIRAAKNGRARDENFLDWINHTFGEGIARHFMVPYNEKFWTVPPSELNCEWLDGFIPVPSLQEVIEGTVKESRRQFGYNAHFWYPKKGGIRQLPQAFCRSMKNIYTGCKINAVDLKKKEVITPAGREKYTHLISTLPLPELPGLVTGLPQEVISDLRRLRWNSVFNLNLGVARSESSRRHWVYFPQKEISFFRVGFPHNFSASCAPEGASSLYAEVSYSRQRPLNKKSITQRIRKDLVRTGLLSADDRIVAEDTNDIKYGYPIYDKNYLPSLGRIFDFLSRHDILPCGRYGAWRYMSMEETILDAHDAAERL
ncbi:MAG: FAD-dependent oxidoreductase [Candidatus Omnitrophica bacterium]|nr:FAD-dependent oxidoreductase [Candidatus Omnitrophota bacterium]